MEHDLPAKYMVLNMTQFNRKHGCQKCKQEGEVLKLTKGIPECIHLMD